MMGQKRTNGGDAAGTEQYVESLLRLIDDMREIGRTPRVRYLIGIVEHRIGTGGDARTAERLKDAKDWLAWATEYEAANGPESLLDRSHPVHQRALAEIARIEELRRPMGRAPLPRRVH